MRKQEYLRQHLQGQDKRDEREEVGHLFSLVFDLVERTELASSTKYNDRNQFEVILLQGGQESEGELILYIRNLIPIRGLQKSCNKQHII